MGSKGFRLDRKMRRGCMVLYQCGLWEGDDSLEQEIRVEGDAVAQSCDFHSGPMFGWEES